MSYPYEVELTITSAKDLKNINWRHGPLRPYVVAWIDPKHKCSTKVDEEGDNSPYWNETLVIPLPPGKSIKDSTLYIDIVHAGNEEDTKPLIGSAELSLEDIVEDVGINERARRSLQLRRPSGRPHGKVEVNVAVKEPRYRPDAYYAPSYGVPPPGSRDYNAYSASYAPPPQPYGASYAAPPPPPQPQPYGAPYAAPPQPYGAPYAAPPQGYPYNVGTSADGQPVYEEQKKGKFGGMGTGLAVGAVAGALGGLALAEGADYIEDKIADDAAEKVEADLADDGGYDDDDDGGW